MIRRATIVAVGRLKGWAAGGTDDYLTRIRRYFPVEVFEVSEEDLNRRSPEAVLVAEGERLLKRIPAGSYVVVADREKGKSFSSEELADLLLSLGLSGRSHVTFILGGPLGLSREVLKGADAIVSFGPITLPHALARVLLLEQLYRATKINRGEKYHW